MSLDTKFPTEIVELPSKGLLYPEDSPLASGKVEMKYMTAKEEDILTNQNYITQGVVIDKLIQSLIVDKTVDYSQLLVGDKNALLVASRILGYGAEYEFAYGGQKQIIDLSSLENKELKEDSFTKGKNEFDYTLPATGTKIKFKFLTHGDEVLIDEEITGIRKINKQASPEISTRLKHMIVDVNGETDKNKIREFVDNAFLARDARAFRKYIQELQPDINLKFYPENSPEEGVDIPIGITFLWPDA
jgi:hypothetical protein